MRLLPNLQSEPLYGRFELRSVLGEGGFGIVYRAHDRVHQADVALKVLYRVNPDEIGRFKREFRSASELSHRNLIRLGELFEQDGRWAYSMELLDGVDFLKWTRPAGVLDEARLRAATVQLVGGLHALHSAGLVHRDLKPKNVLVTREQRVVLLDLGVVASLDPVEQTITNHPLGTLAYMAPEQADGSSLTPASDMYALGVLLYEALTGRLPFSGEKMQLLLAKYAQTPIPARMLCPDVPPDLDELVSGLLATAPTLRPSAADVVRALHGDADQTPVIRPGQQGFVGRSAELAELDTHYARCEAEGPLLLLVCGEGGIGKTVLIQRFLQNVQAREPLTQLFHGRCHAHEQITYKAFDRIASRLARKCRARSLSRLPVPARAELLGQLFSSFSYAPTAAGLPARSERAELFDALLELIECLSDDGPVIFAIDDLQWCDRDSLDLLRYLLSNCRARFMVLGSTREQQAAASAFRGVTSHSLCVGPLESQATLQLASELCAREVGREALERLRIESGGHPLFLQELAHWSEQLGSAVVPPLEAAFRQRAALLEASSRSVLELICVAGSPVPASVLMVAAGLAMELLQQGLRELQRARFVRNASEAGDLLAFHDRVREAILGGLETAAATAHHAALARAWQTSLHVSAARVAHHYLSAGEHVLAAPWLDRAIEEALASSAFIQAEQLCTRRMSLSGVETSPSRLSALQLTRSDALAASGSFAASADVLLQLVAIADGDTKRDALIRSAQRLLQAGEVERGMARAADAMHAVSLPWSTHTPAIFARIVWHRLRTGGAGARADSRDSSSAPTKKSEFERQLDTSWRLMHPLYFVDMRRCIEVNARYLNLAATANSPRHLALALAAQSVLETMVDPESPRGEVLAQRAEAWREIDGSPDVRAYNAFTRAGCAIFASRLREAESHHEEAERLFATECDGEAWLRIAARGTYLTTLFFAGKHDLWMRYGDAWVRDAETRGDAFGLAQYALIGQAALRHLMRDEPTRALAEYERALRPWRACNFGLVQLAAVRAADFIASYEGVEPSARYRNLTPVRFAMRAARDMVDERRSDALLRAVLAQRATTPDTRATLERMLVRAQRGGLPRVRALATMRRAQLELHAANLVRAHDLATQAQTQFEAQGVELEARVAAVVAARARGEASARAEEQRLCEHLAALGWTNVERALAWVLPGPPSSR
jgi:hypothetical protein